MSQPDELFTGGESPLHGADPRAKLAAAGALSVAVALGQSLPVAGCALTLGALLALWARLPFFSMLGRLALANIFVLFLWLTLPLTVPGTAVLQLGPVSVSQEGIRLALLVTLKCNAILLTLMALVATSPLPEVGHAMQALGAPAALCWLLLFTYRQVFVIFEEYQRLARAAKLRCFAPRTDVHTYRTYANLFAMTLVKSWNRARRVHQAMLLRGFEGRFHALAPGRPALRDLLLAGALCLTAVWLAILGLTV